MNNKIKRKKKKKRKLRQEGYEFEACLSYIERPCLKKMKEKRKGRLTPMKEGNSLHTSEVCSPGDCRLQKQEHWSLMPGQDDCAMVVKTNITALQMPVRTTSLMPTWPHCSEPLATTLQLSTRNFKE
jgi:hypothetical protein